MRDNNGPGILWKYPEASDYPPSGKAHDRMSGDAACSRTKPPYDCVCMSSKPQWHGVPLYIYRIDTATIAVPNPRLIASYGRDLAEDFFERGIAEAKYFLDQILNYLNENAVRHTSGVSEWDAWPVGGTNDDPRLSKITDAMVQGEIAGLYGYVASKDPTRAVECVQRMRLALTAFDHQFDIGGAAHVYSTRKCFYIAGYSTRSTPEFNLNEMCFAIKNMHDIRRYYEADDCQRELLNNRIERGDTVALLL